VLKKVNHACLHGEEVGADTGRKVEEEEKERKNLASVLRIECLYLHTDIMQL